MGEKAHFFVCRKMGISSHYVDFGLLIHGRWNDKKFILVFLLIFSVSFAIYCTSKIIALFKEMQEDAENRVV